MLVDAADMDTDMKWVVEWVLVEQASKAPAVAVGSLG